MQGWQAAFDIHPRPIIILSHTSEIILINRASHQIFENPDDFLGQHVKTLPIVWQDGSNDALQDLLTAENIDAQHLENGRLQEDFTQAFLSLAVEVCKYHGSTSNFTASMLVSNFAACQQKCRVLSFEAIKESAGIPHLDPQAVTLNNSNAVPKDKSFVSDLKTIACTEPNTASGKFNLESKFSQLCDAIYHNENRRGFLLAADGSFCYPNYTSSKNVAPVEIDDMEMFFDAWDLWDLDFKRKIPFAELPSVWLNQHRTKFHNLRYILREDGKDLVIETSGDPLFDTRTGEFLGGVVWISTLGEYSEVMANELKYSLSDFRNICDRLPHLLWTVDATGMADYFSQSWYDFTGLTEEQSLGLAFTEAIDPIDMDNIWKQFYRAVESKTEVSCEARYRRFDGQWRWMNVRAKPLTSSTGEVLKWYGSSTEVDSLVKERLNAEKRQNEMRQMLSLTDIGLFVVSDAQLNVLEGRMGWLLDQHSHLSLTDLDKDSESGISLFKMHLQEVISGRSKSIVFEVQIRSRWYKFRLVCDDDSSHEEQPRKVLGCSVDVTEQRGMAALEAENARLVHEATLEMEKSRLKTAFLAHMSHEIRTPIAGIIGTADMLSDTTLDDEQKDGLGSINISAQNLLTIVNDILDLSKIEAGQMQFEKVTFDVHKLVGQITKLFLPTARSKFLELTYHTEVSEKLDMLGDPGRVRQILTNLVSNAIKFTSNGSVELSTEIVGSNLRFVVHDSGEGIDAATMQTLFKPFVQGDASTARRHGGTGLGLTISRNLAQMMGGTVVLESFPSKGTKAILTLPIETANKQVSDSLRHELETSLPFARSLPARRSISATTSSSPTSAKKPAVEQGSTQPLVLIVEDNAINQKVAVNLVRKLGYATHSAWNGNEALEFLDALTSENPPLEEPEASSQLQKRPNLILMDCQMPVLDGYEATRKLRTEAKYRAFRKIPVVALTASAIQGDKEKCTAAGMDDYLSKPVNKAVLQSMLKKWVSEVSTSA